MRGRVRGVNIDTSFFTGNFPSHASIDAIDAPGVLKASVLEATKAMPRVAGAWSKATMLRNMEEISARNVRIMSTILTTFAAVIAIGVVYNNARIALSLRGRDLASLRVLGFTRVEISSILLGELAAQVVLGIPLGFVIGRWWASVLARSIDPEAIRFPLHIASSTYAAAGLIGLVSALVSALLVRRQLDHLDLVAVLKSSE